ncbi:coiled-coil domain-containing protein 151-like, partial [Scleropages formosus]
MWEWDRKAYYESSQATMKKNKETILHLRQENKRLRRRLAETHTVDEKIVKDAFHNRGMEKAAFKNKSGKETLQILDQKVCDKMKKLNALKHQAETRRRHLEELQLQYNRAQSECEGGHLVAEDRKEEDKKLRVLGNRLEKAQLKCQEAEHIMKGYLKLKAHLQDESLTYQSHLDALEAEILKQRQELRELQVMNNGAQLSRDMAKVELQHQEELVYRERRERESILARYKKQAEECKAHIKKLERRAQRATMHADELSSEAQRSAVGVGEEEKTISALEEAFQCIKEATGVRDAQEVVERFIAQGKTQKHLENLKEENERTLQQLKEQRDQLQDRFQEMKYSGDAKLSSRQQTLEECEGHLRKERRREKEARERLEWLTNMLRMVRSGVEHLSNKLQHILLTDSPVVELDPSSEEYVLELLAQAEQKLLILHEELQGKNMDTIMKEMEEEEFYTSIEGKIPQYNIRIRLPRVESRDSYEDNFSVLFTHHLSSQITNPPTEEESEDNESDIITRAALKRQSQIIIDSKTKRKTQWDKSAYYESSQATMKRNKESIHNLRQENEKLRRRNYLEKAQLKYQEAEYIMRGYLKIKGHLQDESLTYQSQLDALEAEILKQRQELRELQVMNNDAQLSRDAAYAQRAAMHADELSSESHSSATGGEEERTISAIEEAFQRIKEATGDRDTHEVVERFIAQGKTQKHLENLKEENERTLQHLKKQRDHLQARFQEMKYSGDTRLSSRQQMLEEYEANLQREQQRRKEAREQLDRVTDTLYMVRGVVEILSNKLQHITPTDTPVVELEPSSEDYVLELLMQVEQKLLIVQEELQEKNIDAAMGEMEKEE